MKGTKVAYDPKSVWNMAMPELKDTRHYDHVRLILYKMETEGRTVLCPRWASYRDIANYARDCKVCRSLFPRIIGEGYRCPCNSTYKCRHLVNVLRKVLRANTHLSPEYRRGEKE